MKINVRASQPNGLAKTQAGAIGRENEQAEQARPKVTALMAAGSLNLGAIVQAQSGGALSWNWFWLFPLLVVYFIAGVAGRTLRCMRDRAEAAAGR